MRKRILFAFILIGATSLICCKKDKGPDVRDSFVATYSVTETWTENNKTMTKPSFTMSIEKSSQFINMVLINNFGNYGAGVTAEALIDGKTITITQQTLPNLKSISGTGTLTDATLSFVYTESYLNASFDINTEANKK